MVSVSIIGYGNVGSHLFEAFGQCDSILIDQVVTSQNVALNCIVHNSITEILPSSEVYLLCMRDDQVSTVSEQLQYYLPPTSFLCHVSGTGTIDLINPYFTNRGIFYPLQTFTKGVDMNYADIPFLIDAKPDRSKKKLQKLTNYLGVNNYEFTENQKKTIHLGAVIVNNFANSLYHEAFKLLEEQELPSEILLPLIKQTVKKLETRSPLESQTGPAKRNDEKTISSQMNQLSGKDDLQKLYSLLTELIIKQQINQV